MTVTITRSFAGRNGSHNEGDIVEMPSDADWIRAGFAERVADEDELEQYHTSRGWYDVPGVDRKLRKDDALKALG